MNYNEIKRIAESKKMTIRDLAGELGMTSNGLKRSIENDTMSIKTVKNLVFLLGITFAEFFGEVSGQVNHGNITGQMVVGHGNMTMGDGSEVLFLRQQIKEKDRQIAELLTVIRNINHSKICKYDPK